MYAKIQDIKSVENACADKVNEDFSKQFNFEPWEASAPANDGSPPDYYTAVKSDVDGRGNLYHVPWEYAQPDIQGKMQGNVYFYATIKVIFGYPNL